MYSSRKKFVPRFFFGVVHGKSATLTPDSKNKKNCLRQFFLFLESGVSFAEIRKILCCFDFMSFFILKNQQIKRILPVSSPNKSNRFNGNNFILVRFPFSMSDLTLLDENGESAVKPRRIAILFPVLPVINCLPS